MMAGKQEGCEELRGGKQVSRASIDVVIPEWSAAQVVSASAVIPAERSESRDLLNGAAGI
ncbi:hypothetical protein [Aminobacter ciceronei]|uniref:Uncharacterized protein n=1 Tax=Aminobacter ciceronei TaxID=150723 RepID=A0ABR6C7C5_9HYPH|nr:hypothetical protein [Aminobacter ciceronei]MBA8907304.1 hypothetical protein [Aminobacter ciceronei]MBA9020917.1 hypothetical protein [Aminobacter ciceronei]